MSLREQQSKFVYNVGLLILNAYELGYELTWGDTYPGKFKHKETGCHPKGLAVDLNLFKDGIYQETTEAPPALFLNGNEPMPLWGLRPAPFGD